MSVLNRLLVTTLPLVPKAIVGRVASRYVAGETLDDAVRTVRSLNGQGAMATIDVLGEEVHERDKAVARTKNRDIHRSDNEAYRDTARVVQVVALESVDDGAEDRKREADAEVGSDDEQHLLSGAYLARLEMEKRADPPCKPSRDDKTDSAEAGPPRVARASTGRRGSCAAARACTT